MSASHVPVMHSEVIDGLNISPNGVYVDATFGRGGHAQAILAKLNEQGRLFVFDKDPQAIECAKELFGQDARVRILWSGFMHLKDMLRDANVEGQIDGVLFDLGVSSPQLDNAERGFSFLNDGPLDMRMNPQAGISAAQWLAQVDEQELSQILKTYGEEPAAKKIARAIVCARENQPIETTRSLADIVEKACPFYKRSRKHPATRTFQAIRIFINQELDELKSALRQAFNMLKISGRLAVISFHSLEDRLVKRFFRMGVMGDARLKHIPLKADENPAPMRYISKRLKASEQELEKNIRARSATLRIIEKVNNNDDYVWQT